MMLNRFGINGKITISYYIFFNIIITFLLTKIFRGYISHIIIFTFYMIDFRNYTYLLEEKTNKFLELFLAFVVLILI